ncbi:hypothetical protein TNCT_211791 [Trichonephila clavata]|uniref:Uncharacterized protein n=1 Tax=Trichonephila clavata TaxID=2740835 RepID=A0A8X6LZR2_TRICU|nr:hypothetical protein TNCT_211791 [Trichonephila clavata]
MMKNIRIALSPLAYNDRNVKPGCCRHCACGKFSDVQQELEEFQEGSRDLETELEAQLTQAEAKNKELAAANSQLKVECERLQELFGSGFDTLDKDVLRCLLGLKSV